MNATDLSLVDLSMSVGVSNLVSVSLTPRSSAPGDLVAVTSFSLSADLFAENGSIGGGQLSWD